MNQQQATDFIIRLLNQGHTCAEIVEEICAQTNWPANRVELYVRKVEAEVAAAPAAASSPEVPAEQSVPSPSQPADRSYRGLDVEPTEELVQFVIGQLGRHHSRDDIVHQLCEQEGWPWKQAERFVRKVEIQHHDKIVAKQSPVVILLGVGSLVVGAAIAIYSAITLVGWFNSPGAASSGYVENAGYYVAAFVTGLGMVVGGIAGIWRTLSMMHQ